MISAVAFEMVAPLAPWTGALGKLVGLGGDLIGDGENYKKELERAVYSALNITKRDLDYKNYKEFILDIESELDCPEALQDLIDYSDELKEKYSDNELFLEFIEKILRVKLLKDKFLIIGMFSQMDLKQ